jgi:hypothetical protein
LRRSSRFCQLGLGKPGSSSKCANWIHPGMVYPKRYSGKFTEIEVRARLDKCKA